MPFNQFWTVDPIRKIKDMDDRSGKRELRLGHPTQRPFAVLFSRIKEHPIGCSFSTSSEIRTRVLTLKGLRPGPLDDGGLFYFGQYFSRCSLFRQGMD